MMAMRSWKAVAAIKARWAVSGLSFLSQVYPDDKKDGAGIGQDACGKDEVTDGKERKDDREPDRPLTDKCTERQPGKQKEEKAQDHSDDFDGDTVKGKFVHDSNEPRVGGHVGMVENPCFSSCKIAPRISIGPKLLEAVSPEDGLGCDDQES